MGGRGSNINIVSYLKANMPNTCVTAVDGIGIPLGSKKTLGFAFLKSGVIGPIQPRAKCPKIRRHVTMCWGNYPEDRVEAIMKMKVLR